MTIIAFIAGITLPTGIGWLLITLIEGRKPVLLHLERIALGFLFGVTLTMFLAFVLNVTVGVPFSKWGFLLPQLILLIILAILRYRQRPFSIIHCPFSIPSWPWWIWVTVLALSLWTLLRIATAATLLLASPIYFDDSVSNWNMRGKIFFVEQELRLEIPLGNEQVSAAGVSSYPPTVPLFKTFLASLRGEWSEPLVNAPHILWYLTCLALLFCALRRRISLLWALLGTYILASLPLFLMHGAIPYADAFFAAHVFAAVMLLFYALTSRDDAERRTCLRLGALGAALLVFTKNEGLLLHLPPLLLLLVAGCLWKRTLRPLLPYALAITLVLLPWLLYKWTHDLPFGNAKPIGGQVFAWQPGVLLSIFINTFFEGNWLLLFPLFFLLLGFRWQRAFLSPLALCTVFVLMIYVGQIVLYLFTGLSTEVLRQTGYARGLAQLAPLIVFIMTDLMHNLWVAAGKKHPLLGKASMLHWPPRCPPTQPPSDTSRESPLRNLPQSFRAFP